jgi:methyltransferase-like protein
MTLSTNRPLLKAAMKVLAGRWPGTTPFDDLRREARALLGTAADEAEDGKALALGLVNTYISSDLVELYAAPIPVAREVSAKPVALASARLRVAEGTTAVANRRHELARLTDFDQRLVPLLDGTRTHPELVDALAEKALAGDLHVKKDGQPLTDPADVKKALAAVLDHALASLTGQALLVG